MSPADELFALYEQWRRLTEDEGKAIEAGAWTQVEHYQSAKSRLQPRIVEVSQRLEAATHEEQFRPIVEQLMELELRPEHVTGRKFHYGKGCEMCNNTGYKGRQGIYEIMLLDDEMRDMIIKHASTQVLRAESKKRGMRTLRQSGLIAIYDGVTTIEEVVRETIMEEG